MEYAEVITMNSQKEAAMWTFVQALFPPESDAFLPLSAIPLQFLEFS